MLRLRQRSVEHVLAGGDDVSLLHFLESTGGGSVGAGIVNLLSAASIALLSILLMRLVHHGRLRGLLFSVTKCLDSTQALELTWWQSSHVGQQRRALLLGAEAKLICQQQLLALGLELKPLEAVHSLCHLLFEFLLHLSRQIGFVGGICGLALFTA